MAHKREGDNDRPSSISPSFLMRIKAREAAAWKTFVEIYGPIVYKWIRGYDIHENDASDIVQDVFERVLRGLADFKRDGPQHSFTAWLHKITRNSCFDYFRRRKGRPAAAGGSDFHALMQQLADPNDSSDSSVDESERLARYRQIAREIEAEFAPKTWRAFWRVFMELASTRDAAAELGLSEASVYQAKSRVLRRFRDRLSQR